MKTIHVQDTHVGDEFINKHGARSFGSPNTSTLTAKNLNRVRRRQFKRSPSIDASHHSRAQDPPLLNSKLDLFSRMSDILLKIKPHTYILSLSSKNLEFIMVRNAALRLCVNVHIVCHFFNVRWGLKMSINFSSGCVVFSPSRLFFFPLIMTRFVW